MKFSFVTLFPNIIECYFSDSILKRAIDKDLLSIDFINPRDFSDNKHKKVDDYLYSGGAGLLLKPEPLFKALSQIENNPYYIFLTANGKPFKNIDAKRLAKKEHLVFVSGRYEGIDERVIEYFANEVFSIGDFILTGGELPSLVLADSISRYIPNVLGNNESLDIESFENNLLEPPAFTKPKNFKNLSVVKEFLKGNHGRISHLKYKMALCRTKYYRPDIRKRHEK